MIYLLKSVTVIWPANEKQPNILSRLRSLLTALKISLCFWPFLPSSLEAEPSRWKHLEKEREVESTHCGDTESA